MPDPVKVDPNQYTQEKRTDANGNPYYVSIPKTGVPIPTTVISDNYNKDGSVDTTYYTPPASPNPTPTGSSSGSPTGTVKPPDATKVGDTASTYKIVQGDTLSKIAQSNGTNIQAIMAANPSIKNPNVIKAGATLNLPGAPKTVPSADKANQYQNDLLTKIHSVPDTSNAPAVAAAAATVNYGGTPDLPPEATTTVNGLIGTIANQIQTLNTQAPVDLVENYKSLSKELGIDDLNTQYMNMENIINGSQDDIRAEVTKAGGTMSESQVEALTASRNKSLILKANGLQQLIATKTNTLSTLSGLSEDQVKIASDRVNTSVGLEETLLQTQQTMQTNASSAYGKIVTNVGYTGLAGALAGDPYSQALAEKSLLLPPGTLSNPAALKQLETYRQQTIQQGQQKINISVGSANARDAYYGARTFSSYASGVNSVIKQMFPTAAANPINMYASSSQWINKINTAYENSTDPKNSAKNVSDLELIDAAVKINNGGNQITQVQVDELLKNAGIVAKATVAGDQITGIGALLNNSQRAEIKKLALDTYAGQKDLASQATDKINEQLQAGNYQGPLLQGPDDAVNIAKSGLGGVDINGQHYVSGTPVGVINGVTLTANPDETLSGSDGGTYDAEGNPL